jgi:hypothetical protein
MLSFPISLPAMTRYASGMYDLSQWSCVGAHALYSILQWAASDPQMKRYLSTSGGAYPIVSRVPQTAPSTASLNLIDEYDRGIATIRKWQNHA